VKPKRRKLEKRKLSTSSLTAARRPTLVDLFSPPGAPPVSGSAGTAGGEEEDDDLLVGGGGGRDGGNVFGDEPVALAPYTFDPDVFVDDDFDPFTFMTLLPPLSTVAGQVRPRLGPQPANVAGRKTLVLDLDETLVHCATVPVQGTSYEFTVNFNSVEYRIYARRRPYVDEFLRRMARVYEVVVFTASQAVYADKLLDLLDPKHELISGRLFRDSCVNVEGNFIKDLTVIERPLSRMAIVDNSPQTFGFQISNGIPILSWFEDETDDELRVLAPFLEHLASDEVEDMRPGIEKRYRLPEVVRSRRRASANSNPLVHPISR
jgi:CTD small phosphatase-like protein 2